MTPNRHAPAQSDRVWGALRCNIPNGADVPMTIIRGVWHQLRLQVVPQQRAAIAARTAALRKQFSGWSMSCLSRCDGATAIVRWRSTPPFGMEQASLRQIADCLRACRVAD